MTTNQLLRAESISKHYDGIAALQGANFSVAKGEVHALVGENGAGKSTLARIIAGATRADGGRIFFEENEVSIASPLDAQRLGIAIIFQELDLFPHLTIAENIVIGNLKLERHAFVSRKELDRWCQPFLDQVGVADNPRTALANLPIARMQLVAIARALSLDARLILMDEPTSSLSDDSVERLFSTVNRLKQGGVSVVFVSHKLKEIFRICDTITVLRDGSTIGTRTTQSTDANEIVTMMAGRPLKDRPSVQREVSNDVLLSVSQLTTDRIQNISFSLRRGEVLGVAGLVGAGRSELGAALFGFRQLIRGEIQISGRPVRISSPRAAIGAGVGMLPEDRKLQGLMMQMSVLENSTMAVLRRYQSWGIIRRKKELAAMETVHQRTALKASSPDVPVSTLSGGNQQKVLLAKWLLMEPGVLFLDDPTRGIDVAAKADVYEIIHAAASRGMGIIFVSSELPELLQCCDRIMVLHEGRNAGILEGAQATQESIMVLATATARATGPRPYLHDGPE
ncbi:MAG TPA: sugar ABC transporter ATP-binding protein [Terriglobia bacterium]|nr:sugar ABC transporter ATP-binding protein [Terriglobia bacterium]